MTQADRLTRLVERNKGVYDCKAFMELSHEMLGSFSKVLKDAGRENPDEMAQNVHGAVIVGYMLGWEQRGKQRKKK